MDNREQQARREARKKRRRRNQIMVYAVFLILILAMGTGMGFGVFALMKNRKAADEKEQDNQELIEEMLATEESIPSVEPTPDPTPEAPEPTREERLDAYVDERIAAMPLEDKVAGLFVVTPEAITGVGTCIQAGDGTKQALEENPVGGLVYFAKNIQSEEQIITMLNNTELYTKYPLFFGVDEEGGSVARLAEAGIGTKVDNAQTIGGSGDTNNAYLAGLSIGGDLSRIGFNLDFAPVADLANVENSAIGTRSYGADAASAAGYVSAAVQGLSEQGITSCLKHFPGIGGSVQDTHTGLASTGRSAEQFRGEEFTVFQAGINAGADMVMIGHISAPELTGNNDPCTFSEELVTNILRNELGFQGVIITDAMNMKAVSDYYDSADAAIQALRAGCDMILMPEDFEAAYNGVLQAVRDGIISEERVNDSLRRIYRIKYADKIEE